MPRVLARPILALVAFCVSLLVLEAGIRALQGLGLVHRLDPVTLSPVHPYAAKFRPSEDPALFVELDPESEITNSDGIRDRELPRAKPPGTFRIAALGDSVTYGYGVPLEHTWVKRLEERLNREDGPRYEVINFGASGYGTAQELALYRGKARHYEPDLILIAYVLNDPLPPEIMFQAAIQLEARARKPLFALARGSQLAAFVLSRLEARRAGRKAPEDYANAYRNPIAWGSVVDAFREFARISRDEGIPVAVVIFPMLVDFDAYPFSALHAQVGAMLEAEGLPTLDLLPALRSHDPAALRFHVSDSTHPSERGHELAAPEIERFLRSEGLLPRDGGRRDPVQ